MAVIEHMISASNTKRKVRTSGAFTLVEVVTALMVLALFTSSVLVVINRCAGSAMDSGLRMQAFEVARENMETLLTSELLQESIERGQSEKYPGIQWETTVESFYEPITSRMWIRGVCTAEYEDSAGEKQTVELMHWLTDLTKDQLLQMAKKDEQGVGELLESLEDAAEYAGVDVETIEKWVEDGMLVTDDGEFIKQNLDLYKEAGGAPTVEQQAAQIQSEADLKTKGRQKQQDNPDEAQYSSEEEYMNAIDPTTGLTNREVEQMSFMDLFEILMKKKQQGQ